MTQSNPLRLGLIGAGGRWGPVRMCRFIDQLQFAASIDRFANRRVTPQMQSRALPTDV